MMIFTTLAGLAISLNFAAFSSSSSYELRSYGVNSGGTNSASSSTYSLQAGTGEIAGNETGGPTYKIRSGSIETQQANVPGAPTLDNGTNTYYNKIKFTINTSNNPSDTTFAVAVATDSGFTITNYVQADGTLGSSAVYRTYAQWGGATGFFATGLLPSQAYWFKAAAIQGKFTATAFGPSSTISTSNPSLTFSITPNTINMGNLSPGSVISSPSTISINFSANAANGGTVYMAGDNTGLFSTITSTTLNVTPPSGDLSSLAQGFGFQGLSASSPLAIDAPYNGTSDTVGAIYTTFKPVFSSTAPISSGTATATVKGKSSVATPVASDYTNTLTFIAAASY